jgi:hypothetical protein
MRSSETLTPPQPTDFDPGRNRPGPSLVSTAAFLLPLASCAWFSPSTTISVQVARQNGETISAEYHSTKDIAAPTFVLQRDPDTGQIETIQVSAEGTSASAVIQTQSESIATLADAIAQTRP